MAEKGLKSASVKKAAESVLLNRLGTSKEVADAVLFLASDDSSHITAQTINVNGGLYFEYKEKTLLIISGGIEAKPGILSKQMGFYTVVCDGNTKAPGLLLADDQHF